MANRHHDFVSARADGRCEYCHLDSKFSQLRFVCDHIIAVKHGGENKPENLAFSCPHCNSHKLDNIAGLDVGNDPVRLFNPRRDSWRKHFQWENGLLLGKSPIGRATANVLCFNSPDRIRVRRALSSEGVRFD